MHQIFPPSILTASTVSCRKCNWIGSGTEVELEELVLTDAIELYCPCCNGYLGFISEPGKADQ